MTYPPRALLLQFWWPWMGWLVNAALQAHARWPLRLTSWYRTAASNREAGGVELSWHRLGLAIDVAPLDPSDLEEVGAFLRSLGFDVVVNEAKGIVHFELPFPRALFPNPEALGV